MHDLLAFLQCGFEVVGVGDLLGLAQGLDGGALALHHGQVGALGQLEGA